MPATILGWFQAPTFPQEEKTRRAFLLNLILNTLFIALPLLFAGTIFGGARHITILIIIALVWMIIFLLRQVMRAGQVTTAGVALIAVIHIATTVSLYNIGTIRAPATSFYFLTIMMAGLTINWRAIFWMAGISGVTIIALLLAEINGFLPKPTTTFSAAQGIIFTVIFTMVSVLLALAVKRIDESLAQARREVIERVRVKEREKKRRQTMEKVIQIGKVVTEQKNDLRSTLLNIRDSVHDGLDFDRAAVFLYDPNDHSMQGSYGTDRSGKLSEEWNLRFESHDNSNFLHKVISQPDGFYYTDDYERDLKGNSPPDDAMIGVKHFAAVACWNGDKPVAVICTDQLISGRAITEEQLEALRLFAGYAGLAIENARLGEQEQNRQKMMQKVIQIGKEVTEQNTELRQTLLKIRNCVRNTLDFDRVAIFLYDPGNQSVHGSYGTSRSGELTEEWDLEFRPFENGSLQRVLSQPNGFHRTKDFEGELRSASDTAMEGVKHYAAVACWSGDKPVAIICVDQLLSGRIISDEQSEALRFFAGYAGLAIENARRSERKQDRQKMMEKVIQIGKTVTRQTGDLRATLLKIRNSVRNELDFDRAAVFLYDSNKHLMRGSYGTDRLGNLSEEWDMKFDSLQVGYFQMVLGKPDGFYFTQDYEGDFNIASDSTNTMRGVKHYAAVACWGGDKPVAVICVDQLISGRPITEEQQEALRLFGGYAGLAIGNTRLNTELEGHLQEREKFITELGNRNAELERFTYTVSHDLRSPLVTIKGFVGMLNKDIQDGQSKKITQDMQRISSAADKMDSLLSDLLELSRIGRVINPPEEIDLVKLAYETLETVDGRLRAKNIIVHISPDLPVIHADRRRIGEVLENLIDNAAKYMGDQPSPTIEIGARKDNDEWVIYIKDNGMGIEEQYLKKVFGLFEKLNPASEGTGIGLALINRIIEVHGGRLWVESEGLGKGSTFCFTIPDIRNR